MYKKMKAAEKKNKKNRQQSGENEKVENDETWYDRILKGKGRMFLVKSKNPHDLRIYCSQFFLGLDSSYTGPAPTLSQKQRTW